jgi:hypothetical protein
MNANTNNGNSDVPLTANLPIVRELKVIESALNNILTQVDGKTDASREPGDEYEQPNDYMRIQMETDTAVEALKKVVRGISDGVLARDQEWAGKLRNQANIADTYMREARQVASYAETLERFMQDFADHGTRCDLHPCLDHHPERVASSYLQYMRLMDDYVRGRAKDALAAKNVIPTLRSQEIGWQYTRAESGHVLWTCRRCKRQAWSPGTQPVACACDFRCCGASDPPCTDFDGSCKNPANYPPAKPAADEYTPGCNFPRCVCPDGKECSK